MNTELVTSNPMARANGAGLSLSDAIKLAMDYRSGKDRLHIALCASINQIGKGNPDWLTAVFNAAELVQKKTIIAADKAEKTTWHVHGDGQVVWGYIRSFLGLDGIVRWDASQGKFKMAESWQENASKVDVVLLVEKMKTTRWDKWNSKSAEEVFDASKAIERFLKKLNAHGVPPLVAAQMVAAAAKAA